jgi:hypothetical protein
MESIRELWDNMVAKLKALGGDNDTLMATPQMEFMSRLSGRVHDLEQKNQDWEDKFKSMVGHAEDHLMELEKRLTDLVSGTRAADPAKVDPPAPPAAAPVLTPDASANTPGHA